MPQDLSIKALERKLRKFNATVNRRRGKGSHILLTRKVEGVTYHYPCGTVKGRSIRGRHIKKIRKALKLTPDDGVSDEEWDDA